MHTATYTEKPLTSTAKLSLMAATLAMIILFYTFIICALAILAIFLFYEFILLLALARFGLAGIMARTMQAHVRLVTALAKGLWLPSKFAEYHISLEKNDAPRLFGMIESLANKFAVAPPEKVQLEMSSNAWVHLEGYRAGAGATKLGIGFDLLCGLNESELEAVLAHEMAHAKLIQRGFKQFVNSALARAANISNSLSDEIMSGSAVGQRRHVARSLRQPANALTRQIAKLVATYSRQDEFEADRGSAEICGAAAMRSSLKQVELLDHASSRLPWRERVAQLQSGRAYSEWFARELASGMAGAAENTAAVFDPYSTHPSTRDRLNALPPEQSGLRNTESAINLFAAPDAVAQKLVAEIQRVSAIEEEKDTKALAKWKRRGESRSFRGYKIVGTIFFLAGLFLLIGIASQGGKDLLLASVVFGGVSLLGVFLYRKGVYKDRIMLPIPNFEALMHAREKKVDFESQPRLEGEFEKLVSPLKGKKRKADALVKEAYAALERCDYLRAHVATRVCFRYAPKSIEAHLALAVAAAALFQMDSSVAALRFLQQTTGLATQSSAWGSAWALVLMRDWGTAEALLDFVRAKFPRNHTVLGLLAMARSARGKSNSAISIAREACTPSPPDKEIAGLLIAFLIDAGLLREASARLDGVRKEAEKDAMLQLQFVRLKMLEGDFPGASEWIEKLRASEGFTPERQVILGNLYLQARKLDEAETIHRGLLASGHYPEALFSLGVIARERRDHAGARKLLLSSLDLKAALPERAAGPLQIFSAVTQALTSLEELAHCNAWIATMEGSLAHHEAFRDTQFLIYAPDQSSAASHLVTTLGSMDSSFNPSLVKWKKADAEQQPVRPMRPGIYQVTKRAGAK